MRIAHPPASVQSRSGRSWGPASDAPTFLPRDDAGLLVPPPRSDSVITSAPKQRERVEARRPSQSTIDRVETRRPSQSTIDRVETRRPSQSTIDRRPASAQPALPPGFVPFEGGVCFDPLAIPLPPELAAPIYGWLRRLALQADLAGADRLLRDAAADLTSALSVLVCYVGIDGLHTLGAGDEMPKDPQPIIAVARSRRALVGTHSALVPITTTTETIAVIQLVRNARQPAFTAVDHVTMAALARESASIMRHLAAEHSQRRSEIEADKKSLYRPEALESHRRRGEEGSLTELSPSWVRRTYYVLVAALVIAICFSVFIQVPTYSSGTGVVIFKGTPVTAPAPGTVEAVHVKTSMLVKKGDLLVELKADKEEADLRQARTELDAALHHYLIDPADETIKKALVSAQAAVKRSEDAIEQRNVRATRDGRVSDIRIREGVPLQFGEQILTIVPQGTEPEVWAYLPGQDRPRLRPGLVLQIELLGYQKKREQARIYEIERGVTGPAEARKTLGPELADALKLAPDGSYVLVKAKLPRKFFRAKGKTYPYFQGMPAKTEARIESKRFIVTLLPSLEKYLD